MDCRFDTLKLLKTWALKRWRLRLLARFSAAGAFSFTVSGNDIYYQSEISPLLEDTCYDCHDYESKKGGFSLDDFLSFSEVSKDKQQWFKVYKNLQAHVMPPPEKTPPSVADRQKILEWIKRDVFEIDPNNPDPGRVTHRRLNRVEYENTLYELTGVRIDSGDLLPNDDTGYGFDNIADALSLSPLVLEKYIKIGDDVISQSIPEEPYEVPQQELDGNQFRDDSGNRLKGSLSFAESHKYDASFQVETNGSYRVVVHLRTPSFSTSITARRYLICKSMGRAWGRLNSFIARNRTGG